MKNDHHMIDGNEAVASVAYKLNEVAAIYPISPSSPMGEGVDAWQSQGKPNLWGTIPSVVEMQSEGGVAGAIHGALQSGSLATTFTASQGLLLMMPNMFKIAGELTPVVFHVAARSVATHALSIFGDHSDVMTARTTGFALFSSTSVQEASDFACIAQAATLKSRIPFLHFFDGVRTSHEISKIKGLSDEDLKAMIDDSWIEAHRARALSPDHPVIRGTAQNPDVFFQSREAVNPRYKACPDVVQEMMDRFAKQTGRQYHLFDYYGAPDADRVIVMMGSGSEAAYETVDYLNQEGEKLGLVKVRLYRPFDTKRFMEALPASVKSIAVLDRTKEPGSTGEPLYLDCVQALHEGLQNGWGQLKAFPKIVGGRYGLSSKDFTPAMVKAVFENLALHEPQNHFTVGIHDDVSHTSLAFDSNFKVEHEGRFHAIFYGLGSDGTVGANKNSIKIIGEKTDNYAQGHFVYDSRKAGAVTISHLRFGPKPIRSTYLIQKANFVGCHQTTFLDRYHMLEHVVEGGTFLLNTHLGSKEVWDDLPEVLQKQIIAKKLRFYVIDAYKIAQKSGLRNRINTVMQVCFFAISHILPKDEAIAHIKETIEATYKSKGDEIVKMNLDAVDHTLEHLEEVEVPSQVRGGKQIPAPVSDEAPEFVRNVLGPIIAGEGDRIPVSAFPADGTYPVGTSQWEKFNLAQEIPAWDTESCIQCGKCVFVCPHSVIRAKVYEEEQLETAPTTFKHVGAKNPQWKGLQYTIQVAPEDCTGCGVCVDVCPAKNRSDKSLKAINMRPQEPLRDQERENWDFFLNMPDVERNKIKPTRIHQQQFQEPLFEFSSACAGCGETPYIRLMTQLFGDRALVANATGCSSIYGGNLPTTPWSKGKDGRGPAWSNSLFEDNAEFGLGFRLSVDKQQQFAKELLEKLSKKVGNDLAESILKASQKEEADIYEQRERVEILKKKLSAIDSKDAKRLLSLADMLVKKSVWIMGGDGWAYDIGFGGLDHVLASGKNVNILILDTEVYSNTGGQMSKSTPRAAIAKFAAGGKPVGKKDLGLIAMTYGNVYVASVAMGAKDEHTLKAFLEAEAYDGPSVIIAYSHCIAHGIDMRTSMQNQKAAFQSGQWLLYRYHPDRSGEGQNPLTLEPRAVKIPLEEYLMMENRFRALTKSRPEESKVLFAAAKEDAERRLSSYQYLASRKPEELSPTPAQTDGVKIVS